MKSNIFPAGLLMAGLFVMPHAGGSLYLDPGSGSFILQMIIAGAAGFLFIMRNQVARLLGFTRRRDKEKKIKKTRSRNAK